MVADGITWPIRRSDLSPRPRTPVTNVVFHVFDQQRDKWIDRWSSKVALRGENLIKLWAKFVLMPLDLQNDLSFARLEAYRYQAANCSSRVTSEAMLSSQARPSRSRVTDSLGRIASVRAFGHAGKAVALE